MNDITDPQIRVLMDHTSGSGYAWKRFKVYAAPGLGFAISYQSGCSCNLWVEPSLTDDGGTTYSIVQWFRGIDELYRRFDAMIASITSDECGSDSFTMAEVADMRIELRRKI